MALWGGRFSQSPAQSAVALSRSIDFDWRLAPYDLRASLAHLSLLEGAQLLAASDGAAIRTALKELAQEVSEGVFLPIESDEDVHGALERGLTTKLGALGGALRAGRSRNDQVSTDLRLYAIDHLLEIAELLTQLQSAILAKSGEYVDAPAPGFTHLQHAQPVSFGHELAKHIHAFARDIDRIKDWLQRASISPLGSGALAGSALALDPTLSANELGFSASAANSIDGVSDRDYVAEALFVISMIGIHLSRIGEEWCLYASSEFGWARVADEYSTGSSIMPQKRNPDMAELARGKAGRLIGNLTGVLVMLKGLPFAYNRDLQEDKEPLFDSIETLLLVIPAVTGMVATTDFDRVKMAATAAAGFSLATEIADYLVRKHIPFSIAHEAAGKCVVLCEKSNRELHELTDGEFHAIHEALDSGVRLVLTVDAALAARTSVGGTAPQEVRSQLVRARAGNEANLAWISAARGGFSGMMSA